MTGVKLPGLIRPERSESEREEAVLRLVLTAFLYEQRLPWLRSVPMMRFVYRVAPGVN